NVTRSASAPSRVSSARRTLSVSPANQMVCVPAASGSVRRYSPARAASAGGPTAARAGGRPSSTSTTSATPTRAPRNRGRVAAEEGGRVGGGGGPFVARRLGGRVGPQERPLHADRERQPEGRQHIDAHGVGAADEERLARPQPAEAALQARPRAQRGDRRPAR